MSAAEADCDDAVATRWQLLPHAATDIDQDTFTSAQAGEVCAGESLPAGYFDSFPPQAQAVADCDDSRADAWRFRVIYRDNDGDGIGAAAGQPTCVGSGVPAGFSLYGYDPLDAATDPNAPAVSDNEIPTWLLSAMPEQPL